MQGGGVGWGGGQHEDERCVWGVQVKVCVCMHIACVCVRARA